LAELVLGFAARRSGDLEVAEQRLQAMLDAVRKQDEPVLYLSVLLVELGYALELRGSMTRARELHAEAFRVSREYESRRGMCWGLEGLAACVDDKAVAARLLGVAAAVRAAEGYVGTAAEQADVDRAASAARAVLGADAFDTQYRAGSQLELDEAFSEVEVAG
jgi:hypothetical protein